MQKIHSFSMRITVKAASVLLFGCWLCISSAWSAESRKPAILFCVPTGGDTSHDWIDWQYIRELHNGGFEVDVTDVNGLDELTWERVSRFNVLFLFASPDSLLRDWRGMDSSKPLVDKFQSIITRFAENGGGIMMLPTMVNLRKQPLADLTRLLGARIPVECIVEQNLDNVAPMNRLPVKIAWTDNIVECQVSRGIRGIWYPLDIKEEYNSQMTVPLDLTDDWQIVVRGSSTSKTAPHPSLLMKKAFNPKDMEDFYVREESTLSPPIFATREWKAGRVALCGMWRQFSIANGTQWLYDRQVLSSGTRGKPSGFGLLLRQTLTWLSEPSMETSLGGHITLADRLNPPNHQSNARDEFVRRFGSGRFDNQPPAAAPVFKGIIGAQAINPTKDPSAVDRYFAIAMESDLSFLVFLENVSTTTKDEFEQLKNKCSSLSNARIELIPGLIGQTNIGNKMFLFGPRLSFPPDNCFRTSSTGEREFYLQAQDNNGVFKPMNTPLFGWLLDVGAHQQIGMLGVSGSSCSISLPELRLCGMAGIYSWENNALQDSAFREYLIAAAGTLPPTPAAIHLVNSPAELSKAIKERKGITYAQASRPGNIFSEALHYTSQYDGVNVFPSDGPVIHAWPSCRRLMTFGAEEAVTKESYTPARIDVESECGLKEVRIFNNGTTLFRRIGLHGSRRWSSDLSLSKAVQRTLVMVAEDVRGGIAVSYPLMTRKSGWSPEFCHDHINDMIGVAMARGPFFPPVFRAPSLPGVIGGWTWDGGPKATLPFAEIKPSQVIMSGSLGTLSAINLVQYPALIASDEMFTEVSSVRDGGREYRFANMVSNPWRSFGPSEVNMAPYSIEIRFAEWARPTAWVEPGGHGFGAERMGMAHTEWRANVRIKKEQRLDGIELFSMQCTPLSVCANPQIAFSVSPDRPVDISALERKLSITIDRGQWFSVFAPRTMNATVFVNVGDSVSLDIAPANGKSLPVITVNGSVAGQHLLPGNTLRYRLHTLSFPVDADIRSINDIIPYIRHLYDPKVVNSRHGGIVCSPGIVSLIPENGWIELEAKRAQMPQGMILAAEVQGLNSRWTAGVVQRSGYTTNYYKKDREMWRELAVSEEGVARLPIFTGWSDTMLSAGHPIIADSSGGDLLIGVVKISEDPIQWKVSVNNPTDNAISTELRAGLPLQGLSVSAKTITIPPGEYREWTTNESSGELENERRSPCQ